MTRVDLSKRRIYLFTSGDNWPVRGRYFASDEQLIDKLTDSSEKVKRISAYLCPLYPWQSAVGNVLHAFVVMETDNWFWSVEHFQDVVTVQKLATKKQVKSQFIGRQRVQPVAKAEHSIAIPADASVVQAIELLLNEKITSRPYRHIKYTKCAAMAPADNLSKSTNEPPKAEPEALSVSPTNEEMSREATQDVVPVQVDDIGHEIEMEPPQVADEHHIDAAETSQVAQSGQVIVLETEQVQQSAVVKPDEQENVPAPAGSKKKKKKKKKRSSGAFV